MFLVLMLALAAPAEAQTCLASCTAVCAFYETEDAPEGTYNCPIRPDYLSCECVTYCVFWPDRTYACYPGAECQDVITRDGFDEGGTLRRLFLER